MIGTMLAAGAGAGIISAGSIYANKQNLDYSRWKNNVDWAIASQNNATQIDMANTAHQREVRDLRAAGLNPILSAGGNGSSVPSLTSPEMSTPQVENPVSSFGPSARQVAQMMSDQTAADIGLKQATTSNLETQNTNIKAQNRLIQAQAQEIEHDTKRKDFSATYGPVGTQFHQAGKFIEDLYKDAAHDIGSWSSRALDRTSTALQRIYNNLRYRPNSVHVTIPSEPVRKESSLSDRPFTLMNKNY